VDVIGCGEVVEEVTVMKLGGWLLHKKGYSPLSQFELVEKEEEEEGRATDEVRSCAFNIHQVHMPTFHPEPLVDQNPSVPSDIKIQMSASNVAGPLTMVGIGYYNGGRGEKLDVTVSGSSNGGGPMKLMGVAEDANVGVGGHFSINVGAVVQKEKTT
jgi:hypothetical protein